MIRSVETAAITGYNLHLRLPLMVSQGFRQWHCDYRPCCRLAGAGMNALDEEKDVNLVSMVKTVTVTCTTEVLLINEHFVTLRTSSSLKSGPISPNPAVQEKLGLARYEDEGHVGREPWGGAPRQTARMARWRALA